MFLLEVNDIYGLQYYHKWCFDYVQFYIVEYLYCQGAYTFMRGGGRKKLLIKWMPDLKEANKQSCGDAKETIKQYIFTWQESWLWFRSETWAYVTSLEVVQVPKNWNWSKSNFM